MGTMRILVVRLGSMGDVIHALPAVASLKHSFPRSTLTWVIRPKWAALLEGNPFVDRVIRMERTAGGAVAAVRELRRERFDVVVDLQGLLQSALVAALARADKKVGLHRSQARERTAALFYSTAVLTRSAHRVDRESGIGRGGGGVQHAARVSGAGRRAGGDAAGRQVRAGVAAGGLGIEAVAVRVL